MTSTPQTSTAPQGMSLGAVARRFGLAASALRYYERRGLLDPARDVAGRRVYRRADLRTLAFVLLCRDGGLQLDEIAVVLGAQAPDGCTWQDVVRARLAALDEQIARMQTARAYLEQAQRCPSDHPAVQCPHAQDHLDRLLFDVLQEGTPAVARAPGR